MAVDRCLSSTHAMYRDGMTSRNVKIVRRKLGNWSSDASIRRMTSGVVSSADW